jgi:hypothetical protein
LSDGERFDSTPCIPVPLWALTALDQGQKSESGAVKREAEEDWAGKGQCPLINVKLKTKRETEHAYDA